VKDSEIKTRIRAWQSGDLDAIGPLVAEFGRWTVLTAYRRTGDWELARDLSQEAWIRADAAIDRFDLERPFRPWLHTILQRVCASHGRRIGKGRELLLPPEALETREGRRSRNEGPERLQRRDFLRLLGRAVAQLTERQREIFTLVDLQEVGQAEAAQRLKMNFATLRATLHQARRKLAAAIRNMEVER